MKRVLFLALLFFLPAASLFAEDDLNDYETLMMFYKEEELVISPTRFLKSITKTAENITVVTAREIERMNPQTIYDILNTVSGIHMDMRGSSPGSSLNGIQGSDGWHMLVIIDGVAINNLANNIPYLAAFPVQNIKRIEIIKGPASSAWGSSLGGVINIITKETGVFEKPEGTLYATLGEKRSLDGRIEIVGRDERTSYYLSGGAISSNGINHHFPYALSNFYGKVAYEANKDLFFQFSGGINRGTMAYGDESILNQSTKNITEDTFATFIADYQLNRGTALNFSLRTMQQNFYTTNTTYSTGVQYGQYRAHEISNGGSLKFSWQNDMHSIVIGGDYDERSSRTTTYFGTLYSGSYNKGRKSWDVFLNDTITLGHLAISPGLRYDSSDTNDSFTSPSLGITYNITGQTLLRAYFARGFNNPSFAFLYGQSLLFDPNPNLQTEKVTSYQAGLETTMFKYFWLKLTLFRHNISDSIAYELKGAKFWYVNQNKNRKQGIEAEIKTVPFHDLTLIAGYNFTDAENLDTKVAISGTAKHVANISLDYDDNDKWKCRLSGHYIWWDTTSQNRGRFNTTIWDVNIIRELHESNTGVLEGFITGRNLLNGEQSLNKPYPLAVRNFEVGVRLLF